MDRATETWGLVIGIDEYDEPAVRRLTGAAADAVAAVTWLLGLGVPSQQILLHTAPCEATKPKVAALGLPTIGNARWPSIEKSLYKKLRKAQSGSRLFVFLSGHGVFEPATSHRMFLPQEYGNNELWKAIDLESLITVLRSTRFERQFLFMDGCQNYAYPEMQRPTIDPNLVSLVGITARPDTGLVACYAASQGQYALEINGRGAMMRPLLDLLDCRRLRPDVERDAVNFDWQTGERDLDLKKLFYTFVKPAVTAAAHGQASPQEQTPIVESSGKAGGDQFWPILRLLKEPITQLSIDVGPAQAINAVEEISIQTRRPARQCYLPVPPATAISVPAKCVVPQKSAVTVECRVQEGAAWTVVPDQPIHINPLPAPAPATASFTLQQAPLQPSGEYPLDAYNLRLLKPDGKTDYIFQKIYPDLIEPPEGVRIKYNERGPDIFAATADPSAINEFVRGWATAVRQHRLAQRYELLVVPPGRSVQRSRPNLRFDWHESIPQRLAGFLAGRKLVFIDRAQAPEQPPPWQGGAEGDYSLQELFELQRVRARPGLARIRIDLPWGRWTDTVELSAPELVSVKVPTCIGDPPLRVGLGPRAQETGDLIRWNAHSDGWQYLYPSTVHERFFILALEGQPKIGFARHRKRMLIIDFMGGAPRVEPFSATDTIEWDLLIGKGLLDALPKEALSKLCDRWAGGYMSIDDELFGVVLGYAAYSARLDKALSAVLRRIADRCGDDILDWELLSLLAEREDRRGHIGRLKSRLEAGEMPLFRWGVSLARDLCRDTIAALRDTASRVSLNSVWTCWVADAAGEKASGSDR